MISAIHKNPTLRSGTRRHYRDLYLYYRQSFVTQLASIMHDGIRLDRVVRPGVIGAPVLESFPSVCFRGTHVCHPQAEEVAGELLPRLHQAYLRQGPLEAGDCDPDDALAMAALVNHAVYTGDEARVFSIASSWVDRAWPAPLQNAIVGTVQVAAIWAGMLGHGALAEHYNEALAIHDPYYAYAFGRVTPGTQSTDFSSESAGRSVKRLMLFDAAATGDRETENYLLRRMTKNPPVDLDDFFDLYSLLLTRGKIYRAQRMALRFVTLIGYNARVVTAMLSLLLNNGRYLAYLRLCRAIGRVPSRQCYFEIAYCFHRLGAADLLSDFAARFFPEGSEPPPAEREAFADALSRHAIESESGQLERLERHHYYLSSREPRTLQEMYRDYRNCIEIARSEDPCAPGSLDTRFYPLFAVFRAHAARTDSTRLLVAMESICGRNLRVREYLGLFAADQGFWAQADALLSMGIRDQESLHRAGEAAVYSGDLERAWGLYRRLLDENSDSIELILNGAFILERLGRTDTAVEYYERALAFEPGNARALERAKLLRSV